MKNIQQNQHVEEFERTLNEQSRRLGLPQRSVLVAVSGGADSMALLAGLHRLGMTLEVASIDHGLRAEAASEVAMVERIATSLGVRFHTARLDLGAKRTGLEAAARAARYAALEVIRARASLEVIATGHTASDQAETVLMRLGRGSALAGAAGILERRGDRVVRPLLQLTRAQTQAYVEALGLPSVDDPMNDDRAFTRVRVRHEVLPRLKEALGPGVERALARFAAFAHDDETYLAAEAERALARISGRAGVDRVALLALLLPVRRRALASFLERAAIEVSASLIEECLDSIERSVSCPLPGDWLLVVRQGQIQLEKAPPRAKAD